MVRFCLLLFVFQVLFTSGQSYSYYYDTSSSSFSGGGSSFFHDPFHPKFTSEFATSPGVDFNTLIYPTGQSQGFLPAAPTTQDPRTLGCGTPPPGCQKSRYRSYDGSCNNLQNPIVGTPQTRYNRLLPPKYGDGISSPTLAKSGRQLPPSRVLSLLLYPDVQREDPKFTLSAMQYGQIITHDMSMIAGSTQAQPHSTRCCSDNGQLLELANSPEHCYPIVLSNDDPIFRQSGVRCMNFVRTITDRDRNCVGGGQPAEQLTQVNHYLDLSIVYGNDAQTNQQVREFRGGRLRVDIRDNREWLPRNPNASNVCQIQSFEEQCYMAGDTRVNQNTQLTVLQVILLREHNRIANALAKLNPHWNDETIFQEARRIAIAEHQFISYYEWLPIFIGLENSLHNRIIYSTKSYVNDYSSQVDPSILNEHATAAFRFFHSLIAGHLDVDVDVIKFISLVDESRSSYGNLRMSDWMNRPAILEVGNNFDELSRGLATQPELKSDVYHDAEITQFMFRNNSQFGVDLKATDIQRNRDHGLASYNDYRHFCGLPRATTFHDFLDVMSKDNVDNLALLYEHPEDVDLTVGGSLEVLVPGTLSGPTFLCILTEQFYRTRAGDRFWFENGHSDIAFTLDQLNAIRQTSLARLLCDNGDHIKSMQPRAFERISHHNAVVPCESLPSVDLSLWKDIKGGGGGGVGGGDDIIGFPDGDFIYKKK